MSAFPRILSLHSGGYPSFLPDKINIIFDLSLSPDPGFDHIMSYSVTGMVDWGGASSSGIAMPFGPVYNDPYLMPYIGGAAYTVPGTYLINYNLHGTMMESGPGLIPTPNGYFVHGTYQVEVLPNPNSVPGPITGTELPGIILAIAIIGWRYLQPNKMKARR
jgi:hypothetical protein